MAATTELAMAAMTHLLLHTKPLVLLVLVVTCCATAEEGETSRVVTITDENHEQIFYGEDRKSVV